MAVITRYFSTSSAGAGDGTSWANRAAFYSAGVLSSVILSASFTADGMLCLIGPGSYTCSSQWNQATWTGAGKTAPSVTIPLIFHACSDGTNGQTAGDPLNVPDPDWTSDQPAWDASGMPIVTVSGNIAIGPTSGWANRLMKYIGSRNGPSVTTGVSWDWCQVFQAGTGTSAVGLNTSSRVSNCVVSMIGSTAYSSVVGVGNSEMWDNVRIIGDSTASSGNRDGLSFTGSTTRGAFRRLTIFGNVRHGFANLSGSTGNTVDIASCVFVGNGGDGYLASSAASQGGTSVVRQCMSTGNTGAGINGSSQSYVLAYGNRVRDNGSSVVNILNHPTTELNYTTDSDDATEYVDAANATVSLRDFRIKNTSAIWGKGYGVSDQPASAVGTSVIDNFRGRYIR